MIRFILEAKVTLKKMAHKPQTFLVFKPMQRYLKKIAGVFNGNHNYYWKSKGLSDEIINSIKTFDHGITPYSILRY